MSEKLISDDPFDGIDSTTLDGWIKRDSDGMREKNIEQRLDRSSGSGDRNPWVSLGNS